MSKTRQGRLIDSELAEGELERGPQAMDDHYSLPHGTSNHAMARMAAAERTPLSGAPRTIARLMTTAAWQRSTKSRIRRRGNNPELLAIDGLLDTYATLNNQNDPACEQRFQTLTDIETQGYAWYNRRFNTPQPSRSKRLTPMFDLLDDVAREYDTLVNAVDQANLALPIPGVGGPAPGQLTPEYLRAQQIWDAIRNETGNIEFSTQTARGIENYPDFKRRMLPQFARLLRTPTGRNLLDQILTTVPGGLSNHDLQLGRDKVTVRPTSTGERVKGRVASAGVKNHEAYRLNFDRDREGGGRGIGSYLSASPVANDTDVTRKGDGHDDRGNPLLSPHFMVLAHELIHIMHNMRGENRNNTSLPEWGNLEEKVTITGHDQNDQLLDPINEQALRNEYGLNQNRFGH